MNKAIIMDTANNGLMMIPEALDNDLEPTITFRAKDQCFIRHFRNYIADCESEGSSAKNIGELNRIHNEFSRWQLKHTEQVKVPQ